MRTLIAGLGIIALSATGCGGGSTDRSSVAELAAANGSGCQSAAGPYCTALNQCAPSFFAAAFAVPADCATAFADDCEASAQNAQAAIDPVKCKADLARLGCEAFNSGSTDAYPGPDSCRVGSMTTLEANDAYIRSIAGGHKSVVNEGGDAYIRQ